MRATLLALALLATEFTSFAIKEPDFPVWALRYPNAGGALVDAAGNSYTTTSPTTITNSFHVTKFTPEGHVAWSTRLEENTYGVFPGAMIVDPAGNVYISGSNYKLFANGNPQDFLTWKLDANGNLLWRALYDPPDGTDDSPNGIGRDDAGNLYVVGRSYSYNLQVAYSTTLKYDSDGHLLWARRYEGATNSIPNNTGTLAVNPHGGVAAITPAAIASYSAEGELLWSRQAPLFNDAPPSGFDADDHLFVVSVRWDTPVSPILDQVRHTTLTKFSPQGDILWAAEEHGPVKESLYPKDLKIDALGQAYLAGDSPISCYRYYDDGEWDLNCYEQPAIVKYSPEGEQLWTSRFSFPTNLFPFVAGLALNSAGEPYLSAAVYYFDSAADDYGSHQGFVAKCDVSGNQVWSGTYDASQFRALLFFGAPASDALGNLFASAELNFSHAPDSAEIDLLLLKFQPFRPNPAPEIVTPPQAQTIEAPGATVTFSVTASGAGQLS
jgi:hypothetical protein